MFDTIPPARAVDKGGNVVASNKLEMVRVLNPETNEFYEMPATELAPGMVRVNIEGRGEAYIDSRLIKSSDTPIHPPLNADLREKIKQIEAALREVRPIGFEEWEYGFRFDRVPEDEINIWLHIAETYQLATDGLELSLAEKKEYFDVALACTSARDLDAILATVTLRHISRDDAIRTIVHHYRKDPNDFQA